MWEWVNFSPLFLHDGKGGG